MSETLTAPDSADVSASLEDNRERTEVRVGMRLKMLTAFGIAFTIVFGLLATFIIMFVTNEAQSKVRLQLQQTTVGGSTTLDSTGLQQLLTEVPAYDAANPFPLDNPLYPAMNQQLADIRDIVPNASPYTYFLDPQDGQLHWLTTWAGLDPDPDFTVHYRGLVSDVVGPETVALMTQGLTRPTDEPPYADDNGSWISTYAPITGPDGTVVAGIGIDYPLSYVDEERANAIRVVIPILVISYIILLLLVLVVATWLTRPLKRLTAATRRIADGEYDVDLSEVVKTRYPDEMVVLSESFAAMVDKVRAREKNLTQQVKRLKIEIDSTKREQSVAEITESDFFASITAKAGNMRQRMREMDLIEGDESPSPA